MSALRLVAIEQFEEAGRGRELPLWRARFGDDLGTTLYARRMKRRRVTACNGYSR